jgi:hypothetical protein
MNVTALASGRPSAYTAWLLTVAILAFWGCEMKLFFSEAPKIRKMSAKPSILLRNDTQ